MFAIQPTFMTRTKTDPFQPDPVTQPAHHATYKIFYNSLQTVKI